MSDELTDLLEGMGISSPFEGKTNPEDDFYYELTNDKTTKHQKLFNCSYWLACQLTVMNKLTEDRLYIRKQVADSTGVKLVPVTTKELTKSLLEVYFLTYHASRFHKASGHVPCDMAKLVDKIVEHPEIIRRMAEREKE